MKVVCTHETYKVHSIDLTYGKAYEVVNQHPIRINDHMYQIVNDKGFLAWFDCETVIPLEEWRSKRLNELGV